MKAFLMAMVAMIVISVGSNIVLKEIGFSSQEQGTGSAVRLDDG